MSEKKKDKPTDAEKAEAIAQDISEKLEQLTRAKEARGEYARLHRKWETAKVATKEAKEAADDAAHRMAAALDDTPLPLFDNVPEQSDEPSPAQQAAGLPISRLDLPEPITRAIEAENLFTVGQLVDYIAEYDDAVTIKGIGGKGAEKIDQAIAKLQRLFEEEEEEAEAE